MSWHVALNGVFWGHTSLIDCLVFFLESWVILPLEKHLRREWSYINACYCLIVHLYGCFHSCIPSTKTISKLISWCEGLRRRTLETFLFLYSNIILKVCLLGSYLLRWGFGESKAIFLKCCLATKLFFIVRWRLLWWILFLQCMRCFRRFK